MGRRTKCPQGRGFAHHHDRASARSSLAQHTGGFVDIADFAGEPCHTASGNFARTRDKLQIWPADDFGRHSNPSACSSKSLSPTPPSTPTLTGKGEIPLSGETACPDLRVEISDQGIGLPKDFDIDEPRATGSRSLRPASDLTQLSLRNAHPASLAGDGYLFPSPRYKV
jgi:hypothetical protein